MDHAEFFAFASATGLVSTLVRMEEDLLLHRYFEPLPLIAGEREPQEVWRGCPAACGLLYTRANALVLAREFAHAGVSPKGEVLG
jgi:hypothetical protein